MYTHDVGSKTVSVSARVDQNKSVELQHSGRDIMHT